MTRSTYAAATVAAVILSFCLSSPGHAVVPDSLSYQGYLADSIGTPVDADVNITFRLYTVESGGTALWTASQLVAVSNGLFSVELGDPPFPVGAFDTPLWLSIEVESDGEMFPRRAVTSVGFAFVADDALTLTGQSAGDLDQSFHVGDTGNPHSVTTAQTGAATPADIANLQTQLDAAVSNVATLQGDLAAANTTITGLEAALGALATDLTDETTLRIAGDGILTAANAIQDASIAAIQTNSVLQLDGLLTLADSTALFDSVNVQVVSGSGATDGAVNGLGNLIVGYNLPDTTDDPICSIGRHDTQADCEANGGLWAQSHKSGSHNVIIGDQHNYSHFGGLVTGLNNNITGQWTNVSGGWGNTAGRWNASVSGGAVNTASNSYSSVSGGAVNTASGRYSTVSGGQYGVASGLVSSITGGNENTASGQTASVSGGYTNTALGTTSSVSGGQHNEAVALLSSISGGEFNTTSGDSSSISGGAQNTASGLASSISGGEFNTASGPSSSISGGAHNTGSGYRATVVGGGGPLAADGNQAFADYSAILGGLSNLAGDTALLDHAIGQQATVGGGSFNFAIGTTSSVSGGADNRAEGDNSSVSGGQHNTANGDFTSVTGGSNVDASDPDFSLGGGGPGQSCAQGLVLQGFEADGTPLCVVNGGSSPTTVDTGTGDVGEYTSIAIGADGFPVISYLDDTNYDLKVADCNDAACTSATLTTVDADGDVGWYNTSIAIGTDGFPVISYSTITQDLKVAHCNDAACTSATLTTVDDTRGVNTSIAIGTDGFPVISYLDPYADPDNLKLAHCSNAACTSATLTTVDADTGNFGEDTSIAIGTDGFPVISYKDITNRDLKMAHCHDAACTSATLTTVDAAGQVGSFNSIAIGTDGFPVISYRDFTNRGLKVADCNDADCASAVLTTVDDTGGAHTSIAIGMDGFPVISYLDDTNYDLKVADCNDAACTSATLTTVDADGHVGWHTSIAIGTDGVPVISYTDLGYLNLKVARVDAGF